MSVIAALNVTKQTFYSIFHNSIFTLNLKPRLKGK